jgi:predicted permease
VAPLFAVKATACVAVAVSLVRAFFGRPPERMRPLVALGAGFAGVIGYPIAVVLAAGGRATAALILLAATVIASALAGWAWRATPEDDDPADEDGEGPPPRIDWRAFDRERARWERVRRV